MRNREYISREDTELKAVHQLLLSAKKAKELSGRGHKIECEKEFNNIMRCIKESASNGYYFCTIDGYIANENEKRLKKLGYKVFVKYLNIDYPSCVRTQIQW